VSNLYPPRLSFEYAISQGLWLKAAARTGMSSDEWLEHLRQIAWPECRAVDLVSSYPPSEGPKAEGHEGNIDRWARAGFAHGVLDVRRGHGARQWRHAAEVSEDRQTAYTLGCLAGRFVMTGVDA
jgi:hypothetical protein